MDMKNFIFDLQRFFLGSGTEANPYQIATIADLQQLASDVNGGSKYSGMYFKLANDIDLSNVSNFTPIGTNDDSFEGTFDGGNNTISNLTINSSKGYQGLFSYFKGTVKNLTLKNPNVTGGGYVGAVVGYNDGTVSNCYVVSATVSGNENVGAVVGYDYEGTVSNCLVLNSKVSGSNYVGAVVGYNSSNSKISGCYYYNTTPASGGTQAYKLTLPEGVTLAEGSNGFYYDGAVYAAQDETVTLTSKDALTVDSTKLTAGENNTYTYTMTAADATVTVSFLDSLTKDTTDTSGNTYLITTAAELQELATYVNAGNNCSGLTFKLNNDIDLKDVANFTPIGTNDNPFAGTFDGNSKTISNLTINSSKGYQGLFSYFKGTVKNLTLKNPNVTGGGGYVGAVVGYNAGTVSNCYVVSATVSGGENVGAVVGLNSFGKVINCYVVSATVSGNGYVGAVVGYNAGTVSNCYVVSATVSGGENVGAVVGLNSFGTVSNCYVVSATVKGSNYVGAVVGDNSNATFSDCYYYNTTPKSGGTEAYKLTLSDGVKATGGTTVTVDGVTYYSGTFTISGMVAGSTIALEDTTAEFTETDAGLTYGALTLTGLTKTSTTAAHWELNESTATYKNDSINAGYKLSGNQISYVGASGGETLITVTGVKSKDGLSLSDKTVTVAASALNQGTVTISDGYTLALGKDVTKSTTTAAGWSLSGSTATYKNDSTSVGYKLSDNKISYVKSSGGETLITIIGVKSLDGISLSGTTVTVANSSLNQGTVTISDGYTLALGSDVTKTETTVAGWSLSGTTATYNNDYTSAGYSIVNNQIVYNAASGGETLITIIGVKSLDGISLSGTTVTVANSSLNQGTVTVSDGYTLALGSDVAAPSTTPGYTLEDNQIKYVEAAGSVFKFTVTGVKSTKGISLSGKTVTISKSSLNQETVTINNGYKLALADNVPSPKTYPVNEYNPDTMTYITKGTSAGYTLADNKITYSKGTATKLKFTGVADGAKAANFSLKNKTITIGKAAVKTDGTTLELMTDGYTLKLGKKMTAPKTTTTTTSTGGRSVTKGYLLSGNTIEYVNENVKIKNSDGKFSMDGTISDGRTFNGTGNADKVTVTGAFNLKIKTGAGNDAVTINGKNSKVYGGAGKDSLTGGDKADTLSGGSGKDVLTGGAGSDSLNGGSAGDKLYGGAGNDTLYGGTGNDTLTGGKGYNVFVYSAGNDVVTDYTAYDKLSFKVAISEMTLNDSDVILKTSKGSLTVKNGKGKTLNIVDAEGNAYSTVLGGENMTLTNAAVSSSITAGSDIKQINASKRTTAIQITGNELDNVIKGSKKKDTLSGGAGNDSLTGGAGNDALYGGAGSDSLNGGSSSDKLDGGAGNDSLYGGTGNDTLTGGKGYDVFVYSAGNDVVTDYTAYDKLSFKVAISEMTLNESDVILKTSEGTLTVKDGKSKTLNIVDAAGNAYSTVLSGENMTLTNAAVSSIKAGSDIKQINASKRTTAIQITGNELDNVIKGSKKKDTLSGGAGNDSLTGGAGNDTLYGGAGKDSLYGGAGNDTLRGGTGNDSLWGGTGADTFIYKSGDGKDVIFGFEETDTLQVGGLDFTTSYENKIITLKFDNGSIQLKDFTASTFHIDNDVYKVSGSQLVK